MTRLNPEDNNEPGYDVVWPLSRRAVSTTGAAARVPDLDGKTVCELWDFFFRGETIFPLVRKHIRAQYPQVKFVAYSEFGNIYGPHEREVVAGLADALRSRGCDAVIIGIGA